MPTYEYCCESCGHQFDVVQSFSDDPLSTCERCGGVLRKVYAPVGIVFKGSGFYKTDSRGSSSAAKPSTANQESSGATGSSGTSASDAPAKSEGSKGEGATSDKPAKEPAKSGGDASKTTKPAPAATP